ncbi:MAG: hypothetical protein VKQ33_13120 [Candidatus Sericytochromatia bacterium]|nr:hypothetical protein [Candidatus Sericytochromatia bacterium]
MHLMDARFPVPVGRLSVEAEALTRGTVLEGLASWLARLPLGADSRRRQALMARRGRESGPTRPPRTRRTAVGAGGSALERLYGAPPEGLVEVRPTASDRLPLRPPEALPTWVAGLEGTPSWGPEAGETSAFLQLFSRNVDSLAELSRTL